MSTFGTVWVMGEDPESYAALCAVGRRVGERVEAVFIGTAADASRVQAQGADAVHVVSKEENALYEDCIGAVIEGVKEHRPDVVLLSTSKRLRLAGACIAAAVGSRVVNDASRVWVEDGTLLAEHLVYGGSALSVERVRAATAVVLVGDALLLNEPVPEATGAEAALDELPASAAASGCTLVERRPRTVEAVNLVAAKRVVSVGRGIAQQEDLQLVEQLAHVLEAEVGCTRPIAEGVNWMSRERYIGVSGVMLKPDMFVAVGVSGQVQHMVGANRAKTIIAINKDKNAPVFKQADYGIVGDLYDVVPQLVAALEA
ncbi:FAD-binding protein [Eggerthella sinensis]|jgi:electron transfer flavoprotein alpha subunit|uniref:Electron transfer flavoprotein subunit alpha n=1 Tax=Eggerthella sinensis TaxID=242230 RepID=A0A3N0J0D1_9ACTN|nr:FAD-binding protein [Eggerthella sinensis]RDB71765.1 electron transfer flavoprotein subunit alpha [Eggerthella sinensis]RNM42617.1 electron transfer flavoprotein subunit alpha [Eggerthella sinensis]